MVRSILILCHANICRSPAAAALMKLALPEARITSAGIAAIEGRRADRTMAALLHSRGHDLAEHRARSFSSRLALGHDLLFVMERGQRKAVLAQHPELTGRVMLLGHWQRGDEEIADPYQQGEAAYLEAYTRIETAVSDWAQRLKVSA